MPLMNPKDACPSFKKHSDADDEVDETDAAPQEESASVSEARQHMQPRTLSLLGRGHRPIYVSAERRVCFRTSWCDLVVHRVWVEQLPWMGESDSTHWHL